MDVTSKQKMQIPILEDAWEFVDGKPHLVGTVCDECQSAYFPPRKICSHCLTDINVHRTVLGNTGRIYAATTIRMAGKEFTPPYPFAYVILEPENIRIPTQLTGIPDADHLPPGTPVEMVIDILRCDAESEWITFKFRPTETESCMREVPACAK